MTETSDDDASGDLLADIAALARRLAATEPTQSLSGPAALEVLAGRLDAMATPPRRAQPAVIQVGVRPARKKPAR